MNTPREPATKTARRDGSPYRFAAGRASRPGEPLLREEGFPARTLSGNAPPGLVGAAVLFWGWETGLLAWSAALALILEGARVLHARWASEPAAFNRLWDLTVCAAGGAAFYLYNTRALSSAVATWLQWLPILAFGFAAAQAYSTQATVEQNTFLWLLRRRTPGPAAGRGVNVSYLYVALCVLAASAANARDARFYAGLCVLVGYALGMNRPRRVSRWLALLLFGAAAGAGFLGHQWLQALQTALEYKTAGWLYGFMPRESDEPGGVTAFGGIGALQLSRRVVMEVEAEFPVKPPKVLRQTSFNRYAFGNWYGIGRDFAPVAEVSPNTWALLPGQPAPFSLGIACYLPRGPSLLTLPLGAKRVSDLEVGEMGRNRLGAVRVNRGPEFARYRVFYRTDASVDGPPNRFDLQIPETDAAMLAQVAAGLKLDPRTPEESLRKLAEFFRAGFKYSQYAPAPPRGPGAETPLYEFLLRRRTGHCEYFASATTLLLRQSQFPTRYATGYVLAESARQARRYVVRERHGHAWTLVYYKGAWHDFDATPLEDREDIRPSLLRSLTDLWFSARFRFSLWRWTYEPGEILGYVVGVVLVVAGGLGWRFFSKQRWQRARELGRRAGAVRLWPGRDSEFYLVEAQLRHRGLERRPGETFAQWLPRVKRDSSVSADGPGGLAPLLRLHYRYRFDPQGLTSPERDALAQHAQQWLENQKRR